MAKSLTRTAARVYGALTALGDGTQDVLQKLLPFFEPILRPHQGERLDLDAFAEEVRDTYKWNFNVDIVEVLIPRLVEAGWLTKDDPNIEQSTYTITLPNDIIPSETEASINETLRSIAEQFKEFAESLSPLTALPVEVEEFEDILIEWLLYVEAFSEKNLDFKVTTKKDTSGTLHQVVDVPDITSLTEEQKFLCARFVQHAINNDPNTGEILARIASIGLLTEVVQDFVKPDTPVEASNLVVYLDAPVALEYLGVSGAAAFENTKPIIEELKRIGVQTRIFGQSVEEIKHSLQAVLQNPRPVGPTAVAMARGEVLREFVVAVSQNPEPYLDELGIAVQHRSLDQYPSEHQYFTDAQRDDIYGALTFQQNVNAREHDADITTLVMRQRRGTGDSDLFKTRFLALTRNGLLAQLVRRRCVEMGVISPSHVPPVIHRRVLATAMWLRTGLGANVLEVPKHMLMANCERVLTIRPGVVEAVRKLTEALGDEHKVRQIDLLVSKDRSVQMLMDKTLGAPTVVTEDNLPELFDEMLHPHLEGERKKKEEAVKIEREKGRRQLDRAEKDLQDSRKAHTQVAEKLEKHSREDKKAISALCYDVEDALRKNRIIRRVVGGTLALGLALPTALVPSTWLTWVSLIGAIVLSYLTITGNKLLGTTTSNNKAISKLQAFAEARGLSSKLSRFDTHWNGVKFIIEERREIPKEGLFD